MTLKESAVTFDSNGLKLAGILRVPTEPVSGKRPIRRGPWQRR
jgi:hypothetical protein